MRPVIPRIFILYLVLVLFSRCSGKKEPLFALVPPDHSGIDFVNRITEDEYFNIINDEYIYNGAGVGVADFNNDGLQDIYFCGNMVPNRLYLNQGGLRFLDISDTARIGADDRWSTGVAIADVNGDGLNDIYVCSSYAAKTELRRNILFINTGLNGHGIPVFNDKSRDYGLDDDGYSSGAAFFDYDNDNDLDLYVLTNILDNPVPNRYRPKVNDGTAVTCDRLYRNNGNGTFSNVSREAGIVYEGYGLGISIVDLNKDGWRDIYITNDYLTNDLLYINNQNGTFSNRIGEYIKHQTHSAMGHDIADINNDGWPDIFTLDMLPANNQMLKRMHGASRWSNNASNEQFGYQYQYKRNMLQLNNGMDANGRIIFSEIGFNAGITATDWSWSALLADFDNDGLRDLFVSNGYPRDVTDLDYATTSPGRMEGSQADILKSIPARYMNNYVFKNNGDLTFSDLSAEWGMNKPSFSHGAAYADLDNDGDLEIVVNNVNEPAFIYENKLYNGENPERINHYLRIVPEPGPGIASAFGTKIYLFLQGGKILFSEYVINHGYASVTEPVSHFGLGAVSAVDSILVIWPDWKMQKTGLVTVDTLIRINYDSGRTEISRDPILASVPAEDSRIFSEATAKTGLSYRHKEEPFNDFEIQATLPFQLSQSGPAIAAGDVNGDGQTDLFIGGATGHAGVFFVQQNNGFVLKEFVSGGDKLQEDMGALLFDADRDNDLDLYIVSGGYESELSRESYQDRLYINDGAGNFEQDTEALPEMIVSGSCVKAADFDKDGDLDLFVGGRVIPGRYPQPADSYILSNESNGGQVIFKDVTGMVCPGLRKSGLVNDALWTDFDNDGSTDLIIAGEWMPLTFFKNNSPEFIDITANTGLSEYHGWWNSLAGGDFDNDGDIDYVAGNLGTNTFFQSDSGEPVTAYGKDIDMNGSYDLVVGSYSLDISGTRKLFPVHFRNDLVSQVGLFKKQFLTYEDYGNATMGDLFTGIEIDSLEKYEAGYFKSVYIDNRGKGVFRIIPLPGEIQLAPVFGMAPIDLNEDGLLDIVLAGNMYGFNAFWGRADAMNGSVLMGKGNGNFEFINYPSSGFVAAGDAKAVVQIPISNGSRLFIVSQNQDSLKCFELKRKMEYLSIGPDDIYAMIRYRNGAVRKEEFYYGNSYLSQSARLLNISESMDSIRVYDIKGMDRLIKRSNSEE